VTGSSEPVTHPVRIVLTGPESSGKTALALHLARTFQVPYALEYARIYLEQHGPDYDYELLQRMALEHVAYQLTRVAGNEPLGIFDTDLTNYRIWSQVVFGRCSQALRDAEANETNHRYLLCAPDLTWEPDPLREDEDPSGRQKLFEMHRDELARLRRPYRIIEGTGPARLACAEAAFGELSQDVTG
jgi:nicotinamide riboside kinase